MLTKLTKELNKVLPPQNVLLDIEERYAYSFDASESQIAGSKIADAVVFVETIEKVQKIVKIANKYKTPIICRGAGTNTVGSCVPVSGGIVLNFSKLNKILELNTQNMTIKVQPGVTVGEIQNIAEKNNLFYPPDPSNLKVSTIGGSIAQNSAGARCFKYGSTKNYVLDLKVVTAEGELISTGSNTVKNAVGYDLNSLFTGSEGTLGIVVETTLKLIPKPQENQVLMAYFENIDNAVKCVNQIIEQKIYPSTIDFMDNNALRTVEQFYHTGLLTDKECALLIEIDGDYESVLKSKYNICQILNLNNAVNIQYSKNAQDAEDIWRARRSSMSACAKLKPNVTTDDIIVPRENLAKLVKGVQDICKKHNLTTCLVGHVGDGSIHPQIPIDFSDESEYKNYKQAKSEMYELAITLGGTISGEHGIGLEKKPYISQVVEAGALCYMRQIKKIFDPNNILNPYKIF